MSFSSTSSTSTTINGIETVQRSGIEYVGVGAGSIALAAGLALLVVAIKKPDRKAMLIAGAAALLGAFQLARGLFLF